MKQPKTAIVIPARYGSTRFPGKPLAMLGGQTMLQRVVSVATKATEDFDDVIIMVATEDKRIAEHCEKIGVKCVMTSAQAATGSDRALEAVQKSGRGVEFVINLQGDAPFTPPDIITKIIIESRRNPDIEVITPVQQLSWAALDALREAKKTTPFSGTTVIIDKRSNAMWFSKNIIPAIRNEQSMRGDQKLSPVFQHVGLYGFHIDALEQFCALPQSHFEKLEGLEQLRMLENGMSIRTVEIKGDTAVHAGIDSPEDLKRAEALLRA